METKIQKEFIDMGFGFPVKLLNVPMVKVRGQWTPRVNYNRLADLVLVMLAAKGSRLTGNQIKFIRTYFEMTLQEFGRRFDVSHPAVLKWEKLGDKATLMNWPTEKDIRLFILERLHAKPTELAKLYGELATYPTGAIEPVSLDASRLAA